MGVLVGKPAPDFDVAAVLGTGEIVDSYKRSAGDGRANTAWCSFIHWILPLCVPPS